MVRQSLPLPAGMHSLASGQQTPFPQSMGTRMPQLCLLSKPSSSDRISRPRHCRSISIFVRWTESVSTWEFSQCHRKDFIRGVRCDDCNTFTLASSAVHMLAGHWSTFPLDRTKHGGTAVMIMRQSGLSPGTRNCPSWMFGKAHS
jgi:hypothetical protein